MIIIVSILYRCTIYEPLGIFKSPVAPFVLLFRLSTECPFLLPRAKPLYDIVPYQESTTLQHYPTAAAVGNTIYVRSQMTDSSRQHAESTTLQPCRTAAAVGDTIYVRLASSHYAAAFCLCRSLSYFVTPPYTTRFCCAAAMAARVHRCGNIGTFVIVIM